MKRLAIFFVTVLTLSMALSTAVSAVDTGNGAISGAHYTLNLIGMDTDHPKNDDPNWSSGHRIFVDLTGRTDILLQQSFDGTFEVIDANGTDGTASFKLPAPGSYDIYARPLGTPGGSATITTCAWDEVAEEEVCSTENEVFVRDTAETPGSSPPKFRKVTQALTTIVLPWDIDCDGDGEVDLEAGDRIDIFDDCLENYFWKYDNNGLRVLQLRFYPTS
jgi:hypothetical protein